MVLPAFRFRWACQVAPDKKVVWKTTLTTKQIGIAYGIDVVAE